MSTDPGQLAGLKIRTIQSPIYVKAVELMGASPTPMAFGEVYTSLQTGVIDGYEHDASTTLQQRFFEVAHYMVRTRHIAGVLGLFASTKGLARLPADIRTAVERAAFDAAQAQRAMGPAEDIEASRELTARGMTIREIDGTPFRAPAERLWEAEARALGVGSGCRRCASDEHHRRAPHRSCTLRSGLELSIALLIVAQAVVVGLQVIGRHILREPIPWTEEIARLLLVWLMCVGGISGLRDGHHPRVTALLRLLSESHRQAVDRGLRLVLIAFFACLVFPAFRLTVESAHERLPASGLSGAAISAVLPVSLVLMSAVLVQQLRHDGYDVWQDRGAQAWAAGAAGLALASVLVPLFAGAAPIVILVSGFLVTAALGVPLAFTLALTSLTYLLGIGGVSLVILPIKILGGVDSFVLLAIPLFIVGGAFMESGGISERIVDLAMAIVGRVRGGLAMVAVVAEILFSGISGSTAADVSAISSLLVPSMRRAGYSGPEAVSVVAAASAMGILVLHA